MADLCKPTLLAQKPTLIACGRCGISQNDQTLLGSYQGKTWLLLRGYHRHLYMLYILRHLRKGRALWSLLVCLGNLHKFCQQLLWDMDQYSELEFLKMYNIFQESLLRNLNKTHQFAKLNQNICTSYSLVNWKSVLLVLSTIKYQKILISIHANKCAHHFVHLIFTLSCYKSTSSIVQSLPLQYSSKVLNIF